MEAYPKLPMAVHSEEQGGIRKKRKAQVYEKGDRATQGKG